MKNYFMKVLSAAAVLGSVLLFPAPARCETVAFPLRLDYPFLKSLMLQAAFTAPDQTLVMGAPGDPCQQITLSRPEIAGENQVLRLDVAVHLKGGALMGQTCFFTAVWDGYLVVNLKPRMGAGDWTLSFDALEAKLLDRNRKPAGLLMGRLWAYFEAPVLARLGAIRIAANAPVDELKPFLLAMVPESETPRAEALLSSLRPGEIQAESEALKIELMAEVEPRPAKPPEPEPVPLSPAELDAFIDIWETWDAFLVQELMSLADMPLTPEEREILLTVLLDARYRFVNAFSSANTVESGDFVRQEFLIAWEKLAPVFRRHLAGSMSSNAWGILAFFTASDALAALDKLGPVVNIEISRNGLIRLARMLSENKELLIQYKSEEDPDLRELLGLDPIPETTGPDPGKPLPDPAAAPSPTSMNFFRSLSWGLLTLLSPRECRAEKAWSAPGLKELRKWLVTRDTVDAHLSQIRPLLASVTRSNLEKDPIPEAYRKMFAEAVIATAWQESCFRQFVVDGGKLTYLLSYNNSSVGLMQINERVWRGIYNLERLRWDIAYNAAAGVDILNLYLEKYALRKMPALSGKEALDPDGVAGALYAMYNAGPGAFSAYVKRRSTGKFSRIDAHFREKYTWVKDGRWDKLKSCF